MPSRSAVVAGALAVGVGMAGSAWALHETPPTPPAAAPAAAAPPAPRKARVVWTQADLDRIRAAPNQRLTVLGSSGSIGTIDVPARHDAAAVTDRYEVLLVEAEAEIARLERERLAAANPLVRGLASGAQGGRGPRPLGEIDAELQKWKARRADTAANVTKTQAPDSKE